MTQTVMKPDYGIKPKGGTKRGTKASQKHPFLPRRSKMATKLSCRVWKWPDNEETGYCGNCQHCNGVDEKKDVCKCRLRNPHRDWRFNNNEACSDWEPNELTRRYLGWD